MKTTDTILDKIVAAKKQRLPAIKLKKSRVEIEYELADLAPFLGRGFFEALKAAKPKPKIIAEVKKASPSAGVLREPFELTDINEAYQATDSVVAISVITEQDFFQGSDLALTFFAANNIHNKPLLRKDFIFDTYQVAESKLLGAQAYLLIASLFDANELDELVSFGLALNIEPLVEVHNARELAMARQTDARCIGVNSRDLADFSVDVGAHELLQELPDSYARVAESGISSPESLIAVSTFADAVLIGSYFMQSDNLAISIETLLGKKA